MSVLAVDVDTSRVRAAFGSLRRRLTNLSGAWQRVGGHMEDAARPHIPVASGALVDSFKAEAGPAGVQLASGLIYASVQDEGWAGHNIEGHHFSERAEEAADDSTSLRELDQGVQTLINAVGL
ncbi:MAG TPA: hypothetical protein VFG15_00345 [Amycolatopsis sp.]|nr:hypothetical protein [Amycolatopsis sp.]